MISVVHTATLVGVDARQVEVETELSQGLPYFSIIGLGDTAVQEARYRVQAALRAAEVHLPHKRITINLAPAALRKDGASLDLPMALGLVVAGGGLDAAATEHALCLGELSLSGRIRPVRGALSLAALAQRLGYRRVIVPPANAAEANVLDDVEVIAAPTLRDLIGVLREERPKFDIPPPAVPRPGAEVDLSEVRGQVLARRALEIAAAGEHNLLLVGNPGSGKTMLARRLPTILPELETSERIEVTKVWSAAGLTLRDGGLVSGRPFRSPHHSITEAGLVGGGHPVRPGEVSLAHHGVLFLDEMPELPRRVLEALRQPLEDRKVVIARARQSVEMPASFMLMGAANPCPCGWLGHASGRCWCTDDEVQRYAARLSGALLDRIDLIVEAPSLSSRELLSDKTAESSAKVRERVTEARDRGLERSAAPNARLQGRTLRKAIRMSRLARKLLEECIEQLQLSARGWDRALKVARTIADLDGCPSVEDRHIAESLRYRRPSTWRSSKIGEAA